VVNDPYFFFAQGFHEQQAQFVKIARQFRALLVVINVEREIAKEDMNGVTNQSGLRGGSIEAGERGGQRRAAAGVSQFFGQPFGDGLTVGGVGSDRDEDFNARSLL
jgi:hypothetical protein